MTIKEKIGSTLQSAILLFLVFMTIRLSGHKHSLGILTIGLFLIDIIALAFGTLLSWTKTVTPRTHYIFIGLVVMTFVIFILYHRSYDSYNYTRSLFWGFNGETTSTTQFPATKN
jgi:hypothetical protein